MGAAGRHERVASRLWQAEPFAILSGPTGVAIPRRGSMADATEQQRERRGPDQKDFRCGEPVVQVAPPPRHSRDAA